MKRILFALAALAAIPASAQAEPPGFKLTEIAAPHHGRAMEMAVWYPGTGGVAIKFGKNPVFHGTSVLEGAAVAEGRYPMVLLSHGLGGNIRSGGWLAAALAERGAIVIAVSHPNSTTRDFDMRRGLAHWTRVEDLKQAYAAVAADPAFAAHIDPQRLYAAGFSYGGWTALSIGGLKGNRNAYVELCEGAGATNSHCRDIAKSSVSLRDIDEAKWNASYRDMRVKAVAAIDPALTFGTAPEGLVDQVLLIGLGDGGDRLPATDFSETGSGLAAKAPAAEVKIIAPASHFSALSICKPEGAAILAEEKEKYPICTDPPGTSREAVHRAIVDAIAERFGLQ